MPKRAPAIVFEDVAFSYSHRLPVFSNVSLTASSGEMVGLLGPNGAGKSTILHLAAGVLRPARGRLLIQGEPLPQLGRREVARRVAVVPQDFSVQFAYTVRQIAEMGRQPHTGRFGTLTASDHTVVEEALSVTGMLPLAERVFNELSGGERQRAMISLALAQDTPILLLDEPTAHLDIRHQIEVLDLLRRLNRDQGRTVLAALHDLNLAARFFPRLILFDHRVVADGPPAQVLEEGILARVYQTPVQVGILRGEEHLSVLPPGYVQHTAPAEETGRRASDRRGTVHVLAGGGSGELLMRSLADAHIPFTAGPLNAGDSDAALAGRLADLCFLEPPYAPVSEEGLKWAGEYMAAAAVILCPMPLGNGNATLLAAAHRAACRGVPVLLFEPAYMESEQASDFSAVAARDFSGLGVDKYKGLVGAGAHVVTTLSEVLSHIRALLRSPDVV